MFVQQVVLPRSRREPWTVLHEDGRPVQPVERYLGYLSDVERSPNTVKAYAHDLKDWFAFLASRSLDWRQARLEDVGAFVAWLRLPPLARSAAISALPSAREHCSEVTVNRKLSAVSAFYQYAARNGVELGELLTRWQPVGRRGTAWRPFLHHISRSEPRRGSEVHLKAMRKQPRVLAAAEVQAVLDACQRLRDRLLFAVLHDTGMRIGEALGLRHEDWAAPEGEVRVVPRANDNGARSKSSQPRTIPASRELFRLYADYIHGEYGDLDSDYVFVNLWAEPRGHPLRYHAAYDLVRRLRQKTELDFDPHWLRHSYATRLLRAGVPVEVVSRLLGHATVATTDGIYGHLSSEDTRRALEKVGWFTDKTVRL
jgi:integrase/recombinase XerD